MALTPIPKKVTFVDTPKQTAISNNSKQIPLSESSRKCDNQTEQIGLLLQRVPKSTHVSGTSIDMPSTTQPSRYKRGMNAQFLRYNPRYMHEPVCHLLPNETSSSVGDCLVWSQQQDKRKVTRSSESTSRSDYRCLSRDQRPPPLRKYVKQAKARGIAPLTNAPTSGSETSSTTEHISYKHLYNCRTDPNEPIRGKLHGSFVWKPVV